jgi:hypothetical protein
VTVAVDATIPAIGTDNWRNEVQQAINDWNTIGNSRLHFSFTLDPSADVIITSDAGALPANTIAAAQFPSAGLPGFRIRVNLDFNSNQSIPSAQKRYNMVHELGHIVGLRHTNLVSLEESSGIHIPGTPCTDGKSVMNGGTASLQWTGFSFYDWEAIRAIYPIDRPAGTQPLLRYYNPSTGDHFYTRFFGELGCGFGGYVAEGTTGYLFSNQAPGTVPVYRYWSEAFGDHFYTVNPGSYSSYILEGIAGYAFSTQAPGTIPIFRYYHGVLQDHLYTQYGTSASGYVLEGVEWYAMP